MLKKLLKKEWFRTLLVFILCQVFRLLFFTWRKKILFHPDFEPYYKDPSKIICVAYWHQNIFASLYLLRRFPAVSMASDSPDGDLIAKSIKHFGGEVVRGSSRHGAIKALKSFIKISKESKLWPVITVDGPIGPRHSIKPGILQVHRIGQLPITGLGVFAEKKWVLNKTWDKTEIPKPFSRVTYYFGPPIPPKTLDPKSEKDQNKLADAIHAAGQNAVKKY